MTSTGIIFTTNMVVPWRGVMSRVVLPLVVLTAGAARINAISLSYLLLFLLMLATPNHLQAGYFRYRARKL